jgi:hypothetical protein
MRKLINPKLFSQYFDIDRIAIEAAGLLDPFLNADTKLFIDPLLLKHSENQLIAKGAYGVFRERMTEIVDLLLAAPNKSSPAWTAALKHLNLDERRETCLGYGGAGTSGSSPPDSLKAQILDTTNEILKIGVKNPEIISLMGIFEPGVGAEFGFILVPKDILRELPIATDWSDISRVVQHNAKLRHFVGQMITTMAKASISEKKYVLKQAVITSAERFNALFDDLTAGDLRGYDFVRDKRSIDALRTVLGSTAQDFPLMIAKPRKFDAAELKRIVNQIVAQFKHLVENGDLSELLWDGSYPKAERASQLVFYGIAQSYCAANDIEISPEVNQGGGSVDFKFSRGYNFRLLVEMKLSKGTVEHGYKEQLEVYKTASQTHDAIYLVVNVGKMGSKLDKIKAIQKARLAAGQQARPRPANVKQSESLRDSHILKTEIHSSEEWRIRLCLWNSARIFVSPMMRDLLPNLPPFISRLCLPPRTESNKARGHRLSRQLWSGSGPSGEVSSSLGRSTTSACEFIRFARQELSSFPDSSPANFNLE